MQRLRLPFWPKMKASPSKKRWTVSSLSRFQNRLSQVTRLLNFQIPKIGLSLLLVGLINQMMKMMICSRMISTTWCLTRPPTTKVNTWANTVLISTSRVSMCNQRPGIPKTPVILYKLSIMWCPEASSIMCRRILLRVIDLWLLPSLRRFSMIKFKVASLGWLRLKISSIQ